MGRIVHHLDVIFFAVFAETRSSGAVDAVAQICGCCLEVEAVNGQFLAVEVDLIFRLIVRARYEHVGCAGYVLKHCLETLCHGVGEGEVVAVDFVVDGRLAAHACAASHLHLRFLVLRVVAEVASHLARYLNDAAFALSRVGEANVHGNDVRAVVAQGGERVVAVGRACGVVYHGDFRIFFAPFFDELGCQLLCYFHTCADRQFEVHAETSVVGCGEELGAYMFKQDEGAEKYGEADDSGYEFMRNHPCEQASVASVESVEPAVDGCEQQFVYASVLCVAAEQEAAQHGGERQGAHGGYDHHDGHHPSELAEQHAGHARHKREREEHGDERKG